MCYYVACTSRASLLQAMIGGTHCAVVCAHGWLAMTTILQTPDPRPTAPSLTANELSQPAAMFLNDFK